MKISSQEFDIIKSTHALLLSKNGKGLTEEVARRLSLPINKFIKILKVLETIGTIKELKVTPKVFSCNIIEKHQISLDLLMNKYDFILYREERKQGIESQDAHLKRLHEEIDKLKDENDKLKLEIRMLKKYGKSFKEKIKDVEVISGD